MGALAAAVGVRLEPRVRPERWRAASELDRAQHVPRGRLDRAGWNAASRGAAALARFRDARHRGDRVAVSTVRTAVRATAGAVQVPDAAPRRRRQRLVGVRGEPAASVVLGTSSARSRRRSSNYARRFRGSGGDHWRSHASSRCTRSSASTTSARGRPDCGDARSSRRPGA